MKKNAAIIFAICLFFTSLNGYCRAATIEQVAGVYTVWCDEKVSIKGVGKITESEGAWIEITSDGAWIDAWGRQGTATIDAKGKKLLLVLNNAGIEELENYLIDLAYDVAFQEGISASQLNFTVEYIKPFACKIDKKTNELYKKFKITGKGVFSGYLDGEFVSSQFTYNLKVAILPQ